MTITDVNNNKYEKVYTIKQYEPANWFTSKGAYKNFLNYEKRGIPETLNWRFITLTINPNNFYDEKDAYDVCNRHIRQFLYLLRQKYGHFEFMKKLEFHKNGFPHWHILVSIKNKIDLDFVRKIWGKGRIDVERVKANSKSKTFDYLFKYACKEQHLPDWVGAKNRFRFVAFSKGFFTKDNLVRCRPVLSGSEMETKKYDVQEALTISERLEKWQRTIILSIRLTASCVRYVKCVLSVSSYSQILDELMRIKESETKENKAKIKLINKVQFTNPIYYVHLISQWLLDVPQKYKRVNPKMYENYLNWDLKLVA